MDLHNTEDIPGPFPRQTTAVQQTQQNKMVGEAVQQCWCSLWELINMMLAGTEQAQ